MELKEEFLEMLKALGAMPGGQVAAGLAESLAAGDPSVAVRCNPLKGGGYAGAGRRVEWSLNGWYIDGGRPRFTFDPSLHQGLYYVQDPSSMVIERVVAEIVRRIGGVSNIEEGVSVVDGEPAKIDLGSVRPLLYIDACAAPGGKATAAVGQLPAGSLVVANEYDRRRADILCENMTKWGAADVVVTTGDTLRLSKLGAVADIIAADMPCSGEGMMRKDADAVAQWTPGLVKQCAALQREIAVNLWKALRPGGYFIYSTCTFNREENEGNVEWMVEELGAEPVDMGIAERYEAIAGAIGGDLPVARFLPGRVEGEGLFLAVLRKGEDSEDERAHRVKRKGGKGGKMSKGGVPEMKVPAGWLESDDYEQRVYGEHIRAVPKRWVDVVEQLRDCTTVLQAGVELATIKGRDLIPAHGLAMSTLLRRGSFAEVEVGYEDAIAYLSRQAITLGEEVPRGIVMLTYGGKPLGFVKNLGTRANNLYPQGWAIRSKLS